MRVIYQRKKNGKMLDERQTTNMSKEDCDHYVTVLTDHLKDDLIKVRVDQEGERTLSGHSIG
jgi:hypothetical protein